MNKMLNSPSFGRGTFYIPPKFYLPGPKMAYPEKLLDQTILGLRTKRGILTASTEDKKIPIGKFIEITEFDDPQLELIIRKFLKAVRVKFGIYREKQNTEIAALIKRKMAR